MFLPLLLLEQKIVLSNTNAHSFFNSVIDHVLYKSRLKLAVYQARSALL